MTTFSELGLSEKILIALRELGYDEPTPIQAQAIPAMLGGRDLIAHAQTGTGKTAAFALPILNRLSSELEPQALVLTPTRELAMQVSRLSVNSALLLVGYRLLSAPLVGSWITCGEEHSA